MRREEQRSGRIADMEFQFWECWESDENVAEAPERHWFRSDTGLEAPTYDDMLQKLYWRALGLPKIQPPPPAATNEWDRRIGQVLRVNGEDVLIEIIEHYTDENGGAPVSIKVRGPNGLLTSSYQEMLEKLGLATAGDREQGRGNITAGERGQGTGNSGSTAVAETRAPGSPASADFALAGVGVAGGAVVAGVDLDVAVDIDDVPELGASQTASPVTSKPAAAPVTIESSAVAESRQLIADSSSNLRDARDYEEAQRRAMIFSTQHPWLWDEPRDEDIGEPMNTMQMVWWGEHMKAMYPELAAAALDREKYKEYMKNYDPKRLAYILDPADPEDEEDEDGEADDEDDEGGEDQEAKLIASNAPRCQYVKADGDACGAPAVKKRRFCHFHIRTSEGRKKSKEFDLPALEDDRAIQMAVTNVCRGLLKGNLEPKHASTLLYGLQVASVAVRKVAVAKSRTAQRARQQD